MALSKILFIDGKLTDSTSSLEKQLTPGRLAARGVFESMYAPGDRISALPAHLRRLFKGLRRLKIKPGYSAKEIERQLKYSLQLARLNTARVRLMVWSKYSKVHTSIQIFPYNVMSAKKYREGFRACVSPLRLNSNTLLFGLKSLKYQTFLKAYESAQRKGFDEAILLNTKGEIVEGSRTNVFIVKNGRLFTPWLASGCLPGITRQTVMSLAKRRGVSIKACSLHLNDLWKADEAFLTNSLIGVMPLTSINGQEIGKGAIGPCTKSRVDCNLK